MARGHIAVFVNPAARQSHGRRWREAIAVFEAAGPVTVFVPPSPRAMDAAVRDAVTAGARALVVVGGDGTVNRAVNAMGVTETPLGVLPLGTGNDFARALNIPTDPVEAARRIVAGRTVTLDLVEVNGQRVCTAGLLGVPSRAAVTVHHWLVPGSPVRAPVRLLGGAAYSVAGARHLLAPSLATERLVLEVGGTRTSADVFGVFVANTAVLGGGLTLPVGADPTDGAVEIVLIRPVPRWRLVLAFLCLAGGRPLPSGVIDTIRVDRATIVCDAPQPFSADGELLGTAARFEILVKPGALRVCG